MTVAVEALYRRLQRLKQLRQPHEKTWRDCFDHSFPIRGSGLQSTEPLTAQQAQDRKSRLLHSAATDSGRTLAAAIVSGATPSSSVWGLLEISGADDAGKRWLDDAAKTLHEEIHSSTFDAVAFENAMDLVGAGWFAMYIDVDREAGGFTFTQWPISSVYASTTKAGGLVDTVFRDYTLTAEQAVHEFGTPEQQGELFGPRGGTTAHSPFGVNPGVSADTLKKFQTNPDTPVSICHAIYPRTPHVVGARLAKNLPIASCHFEVESKHLLRESGYHEMPVIVPRWMVIPSSVYALGPMYDALPDARQLNELIRMDTMNLELAVAGMWIAQDDGVLNPRTVKVGPRKVIVANSVDSMKQLSSGGDWQLADTRIAQLTGAIRKTLMADQLQPQDGPAMTATEVHVRVGLIRQLLGPIYGRLQAEYLAPMIERCFGLAYRAGIFGPAPQSLGGQSLKVKYNNPLARAQKMEDVAASERLDATLMTFAKLGELVPAAAAALDVVDFDEKLRTTIDGLGVPMKTVNDRDKVVAIRDARAKQQAEAQQQAHQQEMQTMAAQAGMDKAAKAA